MQAYKGAFINKYLLGDASENAFPEPETKMHEEQ